MYGRLGFGIKRSSNVVLAETVDPEPAEERIDSQHLMPHVDATGLTLAATLQQPRPDRLSRRQLLVNCYKQAFQNVSTQSVRPMWHGRLTLACLILVQLLRLAAWMDDQVPGLAICGLHFLAIASDIAGFAVTTPLFCCQAFASCAKAGRAGLMLTLVFALMCVDVGALMAYCFLGPPKPFSSGRRTILKVAEAYVDLWECTLIASVALHIGMFASCWRIYKELRENGLYPASSTPIGFGLRIEPVSVFEVLCEIEDVNRLQSGECWVCPKGNGQPPADMPQLDTVP